MSMPTPEEMHAGPVKVGKGYAIELETRETGFPGVMRVEVIWSPEVPPARVMRRCMATPAYGRALAAFCARVKEAINAARD